MPLRPARTPTLVFDVAAQTDLGRVRKRNEDAVLFGHDWIVLADGMGGAPAGDVASVLAVTAAAPDDHGPRAPIYNAVATADHAVKTARRLHPEWDGMGSTIVVLRMDAHRYKVAHVGDSRAYLLRDGALERLTQDHATGRNTLTRVLGHQGGGAPDVASGAVRPGDLFLVCSDGLTAMVPDARIRRLLEPDATSAVHCQALVATALKAGGIDNITVAVAQVHVR